MTTFQNILKYPPFLLLGALGCTKLKKHIHCQCAKGSGCSVRWGLVSLVTAYCSL